MKHLSLLVIAGILVLSGCSSDPIGPVGPLPIPFALTIPPNRPLGDMYAISGVSTSTQLIRVGDSLQESQIPSFYAQFTVIDSTLLPAKVAINGNPFERNMGSDTLRLSTIVAGNVFGDNVWTLTDAQGSDTSFTMAPPDVVDTVGPFQQRKTFRSDTSVVVSWKVPRVSSGALYIIWRGPNHTLVKLANDFFGRETISKDEILLVRGKGRVTVIRSINQERTYKGRKLVATRVAEHSYDVTVD